MVKNFWEIAKFVREDPESYLAYEWPAHCRGWENPTVQKVMKDLDLTAVMVDGCQLGVTSVDGDPILKPWQIRTNSPGLLKALEGKRCPRDHVHQECAGKHTERSGYYPRKMCMICIKGFMTDYQVSSNAGTTCDHEGRRTLIWETPKDRAGETAACGIKDTHEHRSQECGSSSKAIAKNGSSSEFQGCNGEGAV